jgi:hypothetical protein
MTNQHNPVPDDTTGPPAAAEDSEPKVVDNVEDLIEQEPLVMLFGDHARVRIVMALLDAYPQAINPASIVDQANVSRQSWYRNKDDLLATGLIKEVGQAGNSPLYALVDIDEDRRVEWLQKLRDWTASFRRDDRRPDESASEQVS